MRLPFQRSKSTDSRQVAAGSGDPQALKVARTHARRRLMGALVLLAVAVVGFPLLFETQPRPQQAPVPIEGGIPLGGADVTIASAAAGDAAVVSQAAAPPVAPDKAAAPAAAPAPPAKGVATAAAVAAAGSIDLAMKPAAPTAKAAPTPAKADDRKPEEVKAPPKPDLKPQAKSEPIPDPKPPAKVEPKPAPAAPAPAPAPAQANADNQRWVVQVGAYTNLQRMNETRQKLERLGLKTYISDVNTANGKLTRLRLGPFSSKAEAEAAAAKVKAQGFANNLLAL